MFISKRAQAVDSSGIRRIFDLATKIKEPINLSIGQPDFDTFPEVKAATISAIEAGKNSYTVTQGIEELRIKIRAKYQVATSDDVFVSGGVSGGVFLALMATLDPGDEILIPDPFFCIYRDLARLINAVPVFYDCHPTFSLPLDEIESKITSRTRAILVNSPSNPTGYACSQAELDSVIEVAKRHGIWLLYDEIYEAFAYDRPHARAYGRYENTLILNGFSKSHAVPGWRLGYVVAPKPIVTEMLKVQQYSFVCAPSIAQWGVLAGFDHDLSSIIQQYRSKRDFVVSALKDKFEINVPGGAFYIYPRVPWGTGQSFVEKCIENSLLVIPGNVFSNYDTHFRVSFAAKQETLERGVEVLLRLAS